ncbi:hypothetical protein HPP92_006796 [Vanilla planifolia]|uniref:3-deoxy-D-manno-octulosonic-acid transferase N-terminal domain-containing protein n=1 Tax=Vanilla planifolia TaxID=51239 RepID=A0A835R9A4_VANPL|nr:hypothetical protein HPP92_006796 [Vanilla planifolia]
MQGELYKEIVEVLDNHECELSEVIKGRLPNSVIYQFAPVDTPTAMESFLMYWSPIAVILMESELWPNLIISASKKGSTVEAIRFQLLNASPFIINFAGDLKYAVGSLPLNEREKKSIADLKLQLNERPVWMAASIHRSEVEVDLAGHNFSEVAAAGCAVLTGPHVGHFSRMLAEMKQVDSLSVLQVEGEVELLKALMQLLSNIDLLEAHRKSAKSAFSAVSKGVVHRAWNHI